MQANKNVINLVDAANKSKVIAGVELHDQFFIWFVLSARGRFFIDSRIDTRGIEDFNIFGYKIDRDATCGEWIE